MRPARWSPDPKVMNKKINVPQSNPNLTGMKPKQIHKLLKFQSLSEQRSEQVIDSKLRCILMKVGLKASGISKHQKSYNNDVQAGFTVLIQQKGLITAAV